MMFSFTLIKAPCPTWLSFFLHRWQSTYHPSLYRITHTCTDFAGWAALMQFGQESSASPLPNLVLLSACPWQHRDTALAPLVAHWGRGHGGPRLVAEEMKHRHWPCCCTQAGKAKTNSDTACRTLLRHLRHSSSLGLWPCETHTYKGGFLPPFLPHSSSTLKYASYQYEHFRRKTYLIMRFEKLKVTLEIIKSIAFQSVLKSPRISQTHLELLCPKPLHTHPGKERKEWSSRTPCPPSPSTAVTLLWSAFLFTLEVLIRFPLQKGLHT